MRFVSIIRPLLFYGGINHNHSSPTILWQRGRGRGWAADNCSNAADPGCPIEFEVVLMHANAGPLLFVILHPYPPPAAPYQFYGLLQADPCYV